MICIIRVNFSIRVARQMAHLEADPHRAGARSHFDILRQFQRDHLHNAHSGQIRCPAGSGQVGHCCGPVAGVWYVRLHALSGSNGSSQIANIVGWRRSD